MMVEVRGIAYLVHPFPFLFLLLFFPGVLGKELLFLQKRVGHIHHFITRQHGSVRVIGIIVEDK